MWFQLIIEPCPALAVEELSEQLEEWGALSVVYTDKNDDAIFEPPPGTTPLWPEVVIQALFTEAAQAQSVQQQLSLTQPALNSRIEVLPDKDWERAWMNDFKPRQFGERLWICPTWSTPPDPHAVNLMLDPGLAFGTGTHPTTSLCLRWLESAALNQKTVIDYGCGSGILAIAALKLGAKHLFAVDIDEQALTATRNNAASNHIDDDQVTITFPDTLTTSVDVLIANILLGPLISLKERFQTLLKSEGQLVVSGILEEQARQLIDAYDSVFILKKQFTEDDWSLLVFQAGCA